MKNHIALLLIIVLVSCKDNKNNKTVSVIFNQDSLNIITQKKDSLNKIIQEKDSLRKLDLKAKAKFKNIRFKPIWGDRLTIYGDFDGDGIIDTLKESFISRLTNKETYKGYTGYNYNIDDKKMTFYELDNYTDTLINFMGSKKPEVLLKCSNKNVSTLKLPYSSQSTGLNYLINVGDLNNDKRDEIAIVRSFIRFEGTMSHCEIYSYDGVKWKDVFSISLHDVDDEEVIKKSKINNDIPEYLEKKNGVWYYFDYKWNVIDGIDFSKMKPLKLNKKN